MKELKSISEVEALLDASRTRSLPAVVLVYSDGCPPCAELHPKVEKVARERTDIDFYAFNAERYMQAQIDPEKANEELTVFFASLELQFFPTQIFIPRTGRYELVPGTKQEIIDKALARLL
ncbi:thioredoxin family protein [Pseudomonas sp. LS1212]|uniref:TlpA family protein disulfide reductase n=1 Tax=Pseudomonas sp. LS1212 TaxID=2972478 RepID=UPI00215BC2C9|nr:thioredoxin family protein [Pseudomonas sp. LS1212]UVJ44890.1 thioredoxin family protein [Pseudomonas sp. LS1212]